MTSHLRVVPKEGPFLYQKIEKQGDRRFFYLKTGKNLKKDYVNPLRKKGQFSYVNAADLVAAWKKLKKGVKKAFSDTVFQYFPRIY